MKRPMMCVAGLVLAALPAFADTTKPYAGFQDRAVTSLSDGDLTSLRAGEGWGLALPAELNGYPGPKHVLELAAELELSPEQTARVEAIFAEMRAEAIAAGQAFIDAEKALDAGFSDGGLTAAALERLIATAGEARAALRMVHLSRHLQMVEVLTSAQVERYVHLRGYTADPCAAVPDGHDPEMWRRHNGCDG